MIRFRRGWVTEDDLYGLRFHPSELTGGDKPSFSDGGWRHDGFSGKCDMQWLISNPFPADMPYDQRIMEVGE